jgi:hypothetical protein
MRKLITFLLAAGLVFVFSAPAPAADKTVEERLKALEDTVGSWTIYGTARFATFYQKDTAGDIGGGNFNDDNKASIWDLQSNSRIGLAAKRGDLGGDFLLGMKEPAAGGPKIRHAYGTYQAGDFGFLIGKAETIFTNFTYSNQCGNPYGPDTDLQDWGFIDEDFTPLVQMTFKGLTLQLVKSSPSINTGGTNTYDALLPHLEFQYHLAVDKFYGDVFGGFGTVKVKDVTVGTTTTNVDKSVNGYAIGIGGGANIDPVYCGASFWYGKNSSVAGVFSTTMDVAGGPAIDPTTGDLTDEKDLGVGVVVGANIQKVTVEAGYGFTSSKPDVSGADTAKGQSAYLQAVVPIAETPGAKFFVVPEVGMFDQKLGSTKQGKTVYGGAKWQINF